MTLGMDFANGKDKTVYTIKKDDKEMILENRYIVLREKSTGRYLTIGNLQGKIVTGAVEDIRCAYVFDAENNDILSIAEKLLTDEWEIEYIVQLPLYSSLGYGEKIRPILKEAVEITAWREANGGFSSEPIKYKVEFGVKVRPYKLDCTFFEVGNTAGNQIGFEKIDTPQTLNLITNKDIYLTYEACRKVNEIMLNHCREAITEKLTSAIEHKISSFLKDCFLNNEASFDNPGLYKTMPDVAICTIHGDPYFEHY